METNAKSGYVYVLHAEGTNRFKIGYSVSPIQRQQKIEGQSPFPIKLICDFPTKTAYIDEQKIHRMFAHRRKHGEWFEFESIDHIKTLVGEYFNLKSIDYCNNYNLILKQLYPFSSRFFFNQHSKLILFENGIAVIEIVSVKLMLDTAEKFRNDIEAAFYRYFGFNVIIKFTYEIFESIKLESNSENIKINSILDSEDFICYEVDYEDDNDMPF